MESAGYGNAIRFRSYWFPWEKREAGRIIKTELWRQSRACVLHYVLEHGLEGLEEKDLKEMLRFANAAASLITTRKGALRVMPEKEEIEKML